MIDPYGIVTAARERREMYAKKAAPLAPKTMATRKPPSRHPLVQQVNPFLTRAAGLYLRGYFDGTSNRRVLSLYTVPVGVMVDSLATYLGEPVAIAISARRSRSLARPRQAAMFAARIYCPASLPDIGRAFGNRDHTTAMHAIQVVEERLARKDVPTMHAVEALISIAGVDPARLTMHMAQRAKFDDALARLPK